ncbi:MAG: hypothetical protein Q8Q73_07015 [Stagnimonas sp.]|nr:hypothetical protein [Stagnimonas sp.]
MKLEGGFTSATSEKFLRKLAEAELDDDLLVPTNARHAYVGGEASIIQLIITWALSKKKPRLLIHANAGTDLELSTFIGRAHGIVSAFSCDIAKTYDGNIDVTQRLRSLARTRQQQLSDPNSPYGMRGLISESYCVDHEELHDPRLYIGTEFDVYLRSEAELAATIPLRIIEPAIPDKYKTIFSSVDISELGALAYELFKNTDEHARKSWDGIILEKSIRGIFSRNHLVSPETLENKVTKETAFGRYLSKLKPEKNSSKVRFLEISIFDSGPGYAQCLRKKPTTDMTLAEEFLAVSDCFKKNISSKNDPNYGKGLPTVANILNRHNGFLKLRTGRLSLCISPDKQASLNAVPRLVDSIGSERPVPRSPVNGTLVTLIVPLIKS